MKTDSKTLRATLQKHFGYDVFRPGQETVIRALLEGRSAMALFPTGAGKSLCYQLPALMMEGTTLVVSPLIALMKDQVERLQERGIAAARIDSTLTAEEMNRVLQDLTDGRLKLLYLAPERLLKESFMERLRDAQLTMMAVDEAHCISEWGHNFRPEYLRLARVAQDLGLRRVLALTATATPRVAEDVCREFAIAEADLTRTSFVRSNLEYRITPVADRQRLGFLVDRLRETEGAAVVYVTLQHTAESVATALQKAGLSARAYHAGLSAEHRSEAQEAFMQGEIRVMVATIAFGMGIDKSDIRAVFHYNQPKTLENYQQETGRAGRDGGAALCEWLACEDDVIVLENFIYGDTPTEGGLRQLVDHLLRQGREFDVSMWDLSQATDIRSQVIETVVTQLELEGVLQPLGSFYAGYQLRLLQTEARWMAGYDEGRQRFLKRLLEAGERARSWITFDLDEVAARMGEPQDRIRKALHWLEEAGEAVLKPFRARQRYRLLEAASERRPSKVAAELAQRFAAREKQDVERLQTVLKVARGPGCVVRALAAHFGEETSACGRCSHCWSGEMKVWELPAAPIPEITDEDVAVIAELSRQRLPALRQARQMARFLCGLSSPAATRARLTRHDAFGLLERVPFPQVLALVEARMGG